MKTLNTEQQVELQEIFERFSENARKMGLSPQEIGLCNYWKNELKSKRPRRLPKEINDAQAALANNS